jgi:hypothetical protein
MTKIIRCKGCGGKIPHEDVDEAMAEFQLKIGCCSIVCLEYYRDKIKFSFR